MQIDWFSIVAQALNFLVLLWLMKRFLFKPILRVIDEREARISGQLASAEAMKIEAQKQQVEYEEKIGNIDRERAAMMKEAEGEARAESERLLREAREAAENFSAKRREAEEIEELALRQEINRRTRDEVFAIARKALTALAGTSLEKRIVELFNDRIRTMGDGEAQTLRTALKGTNDSIIVRTSLALETEQKDATEATIRSLLGTDTRILFETAPDMISGIELDANGHKAAWSIDGYLSVIDEGARNDHDA